jgi:hypothetical protein
VAVEKPVAFTVMVYIPGLSRGNRKSPAAFVVTVWVVPISLLVRVTVAVGTTAREVSVTLPVTSPEIML